MRFVRTYVAVFLSLVLVTAVFPQQTATSSPQALALLQKSLTALTGGQTLSDVTLTGSARRIAGSTDETGTVTLKALATGESRLDLALPSGTRTEVRTFPTSGPSGSWVGSDGVVHAMSQHNLWTDSSWFFPAFTSGQIQSGSHSVSYSGHETSGAQAVEHISMTRRFQATGAPPGWAPDSLEHLSTMDLYVDSTSLLPATLSFMVHPDRNALIDIPVTIRFSDYRSVGGLQIPFHIQKFFNNSLDLDLQLQNTSINSGLSATTFQVQ